MRGPTDGELLGVSQLIHTRQVVAAMERDGVRDPSMLVAAITHDLGKVLLLMAEAPEHVVGMTAPIGPHLQGIGLDNVVLQWSHDEFVYSRLRDHVPDHVAWLLRYHSILIDQAEPFMDARDRAYLERYLRPFRIYDQGSKSPCLLPSPTALESIASSSRQPSRPASSSRSSNGASTAPPSLPGQWVAPAKPALEQSSPRHRRGPRSPHACSVHDNAA